MTMTKEDAAAVLDGNEYGSEGSKELFADMKAAGLVAVFGYSDDNVELRGAIEDEVGAYDGGTVFLTPSGLLTNDCDNDQCPHYLRAQLRAAKIEAMWGAEPGISWTYKTPIPHAEFFIKEDGQTYCRGIVFSLADVPTQ